MTVYRKPLCAAVTLAAVLAFASPAMTQELPTGAPPPATTDAGHIPLSSAAPSAPAAEAPAPAKAAEAAAPKEKTVAKKVKHVKHKKKKNAQKTSSRAQKLTKKSSATIHQPKSKKKVSAKSARTKEVHKVKPSHTKTARKADPKTVHKAEAKPVQEKSVKAPMKLVTAKSGSRNVVYAFCLGYDNCVPHRYEASISGGKITSAKIYRETPEGNWAEGKIDPVMGGDLDKLASRETDAAISRNLTAGEKARIADHQGRVHATLVSDVMAGTDRKEQVKATLRELRIRNAEELEADYPKISQSDVAVQAVNELAAEKQH